MATFPNIGRFLSLDQLLSLCDLAHKHELAGTQPDFMNPGDLTRTDEIILYSCLVKAYKKHNGRNNYQNYLQKLGLCLDNYRGKSINEVLAIMYTGDKDNEYYELTHVDCQSVSNLIKNYVEIPAATFVHFFRTDYNAHVADALIQTRYYVYVVETHDGVIYSHDTKFNLVSLVLATNDSCLIYSLLSDYIQNVAEQTDFSGRIPIDYIPPNFEPRLTRRIRKVLTPQWSPQYQYCYPQYQALITTVMTINHIPNNVLHLLPQELVYIILRFIINISTW